MFITQKDNGVGGDLVAGDKTTTTTINLINSASIEELTFLYTKIKNGNGESSDGTFCEQLEHYMSPRTEGDVRGLKAKLIESGRSDDLEHATREKERAAKAVMRYQTSRTAQRIYTIILDELHTNFKLIVTPAIQEGVTRREADLCILEAIQRTKNVLV